MSKSDLHPWQVILGCLFELDSYEIPQIIEKTGMAVNWSLTERENYSHKLRTATYRPRINSAYKLLSEEDQLRVAHIVASELANKGQEEALNAILNKIGWQVKEGRLIPIRADVKELFFPKDSQHDAYVEIRNLIQSANVSITIVDPYLDGSIFKVIGTVSALTLNIKLLSKKYPSDFIHETDKFLLQHHGFTIEPRQSKEFHDRFIIVDDKECWHLGCSIKDAGNAVFMMSKFEDNENKIALIKQLETSWTKAEEIK